LKGRLQIVTRFQAEGPQVRGQRQFVFLYGTNLLRNTTPVK
jgi:hypothetical protein